MQNFILIAATLLLACGGRETPALRTPPAVVAVRVPVVVPVLPAEPLADVVPVTEPVAVSTPDNSESDLETAILDRAMECQGAKVGKFDRSLLRDLLRIEEKYQVPDELRGMVLVSACHESGYDPDAEGDHRFARKGKAPPAIGILQQWPWWERAPYRINRRDPHQAADAWLKHVRRFVPIVRRQCNFDRDQIDEVWRTAWVTAVSAPSKTPRCEQVSNHWRRFLEWRVAWEHLLEDSQIATCSR